MGREKMGPEIKRTRLVQVRFSNIDFLRLERARIKQPIPIPTRSTLIHNVLLAWIAEQEK